MPGADRRLRREEGRLTRSTQRPGFCSSRDATRGYRSRRSELVELRGFQALAHAGPVPRGVGTVNDGTPARRVGARAHRHHARPASSSAQRARSRTGARRGCPAGTARRSSELPGERQRPCRGQGRIRASEEFLSRRACFRGRKGRPSAGHASDTRPLHFFKIFLAGQGLV